MGKKAIKPFSRVVKTRLRSSKKATGSNIVVTVERTAEGNVSCSLKGKEKKSKSCSQSGMESDSEDLDASVGVTAGSCGATTEADQEVRGESDDCKMAAGSEELGSHVALEVAESALTNQEMAAACEEHGSCVALKVAESARSDQEMAAACEVHGSRVALESEQVMAAGPLGKAGEVHKGTETVIQYDTIINALKELRCLEEKQNNLNRDIDRLIKNQKLLRGERRTQYIRELAFLNKELEETEINIKDILAVIEPWKELYGNKQRFEQMKEGNVTAERLLKVAELLKETEVSKTFTECSVATNIVHSNGLSHTDSVCAAAVSGVSAGGSVGQAAESGAAEVQVIAGNAMCVSEGGGAVSAGAAEVQVIAGNAMCVTEGGGAVSSGAAEVQAAGSGAGCRDALSDQEMAAACEVHGSRVAQDSEQVMAAGPLGKAGEVHKGTETVIQYDTIINALKELRCLEEKQSKLNRDIDRLIKSEDSLKGERRTRFIREVTFLNKELEETEIYIKDILAVIEPWRELYGNKQRFEQMKEGNVTTERLLKVTELLKETEVSKTVAECSVATDTVHSNGLSNTDGVVQAAGSGAADVQVIAG
eukprot:XP_017945220.1 PREDICTED: uncharacterized protein LOC108644842 [Xenopus tropicalis]